jgi:hypothetical protein
MIGMDFIHPREVGERTIFTRWWFWIGIVVLAAGAWFARVHFLWQGETAQYGAQNALANAYMQMQEKKAADLKAAYQADTYGGATPEETLRLFVEALEKKDYVLASRYFVVEKQTDSLKEFHLGEQGGANIFIVDAYRNGEVRLPSSVGSIGIYEIEIFPKGESTAFAVRLIKNPESGKWKIESL